MLAIYLQCFIRDKYRCRHCNSSFGLHPHHIIYRSQGGLDELSNLITLCHSCHIDGVHGGKLILTVVNKTEDNVVVSFKRLKGWIPR